MSLKNQISEDMKTAMKAKDSATLSAIRLLMAQIKQEEVDHRIELDDAGIIAAIDKMLKQRRDSITQYTQGGRQDLADKEQAEIDVLQRYLPQPLTEQEIDGLIDSAIQSSGASGMQAMGKVMALLKPQLTGRADVAAVSARVKARLS